MATITFEIKEVIVDGTCKVSAERLETKEFHDQSLLIQTYIAAISALVSDVFESEQFHENVKEVSESEVTQVIHSLTNS